MLARMLMKVQSIDDFEIQTTCSYNKDTQAFFVGGMIIMIIYRFSNTHKY